MNFQQKRHVMNILSSLLIMGIYGIWVWNKFTSGGAGLEQDLVFWARSFLILIPVAVVGKILLTILFAIFMKVTTGEEEPPITDERDRLIELKSNQIAQWIFVSGFLGAMVAVWLGQSVAVMFLIFAASGLVADMVGETFSIVMYRTGE